MNNFGNLSGLDLQGFHQGGDTEAYKRLGSHLDTVHDPERGDLAGTRFAVWAPNAARVQVIGDFNWWQGDDMALVPDTGVWALWKEGVGEGAVYKYRIHHHDGSWTEKVDPYSAFNETPPGNSSIVYQTKYEWSPTEQAWLDRRANWNPYTSQFSIYELHLGSWRKGMSYLELAEVLPAYVKFMGYTHVEFMPVMSHPLGASWGYQVTGYFAPDSRLGKPDDLRHLIEALHAEGIGVVLDWVPGHFPKDEWALGRFDGTALYEHADPRQGEQQDWGTYVFNFGRNEVKSFLVSNALYWIHEFHADALRVDAVASMLYLDYSRKEGEWVPNQFGGRENLEAIDLLRYVNRHLYEREPGVILIAEESTSFGGVSKPVYAGGLGFGFKWNMGWMNDSLRYMELDPIYRQYQHNDMTFAMVYAYSENFILPISHDEVVHGKGSMLNKMPGDEWQQFATLKAFFTFMWGFPGKQLVFMGQEFAQRPEWNEGVGLEWWVDGLPGHRDVREVMRSANLVQGATPALYELDCDPAGFQWIQANDNSGNTFGWVRKDSSGGMVACVTNFSPQPHPDYRFWLPTGGTWTEVLNTDDVKFGGTGNYVNGTVESFEDNGENYFVLQVPPMATVWMALQAKDDQAKEVTAAE